MLIRSTKKINKLNFYCMKKLSLFMLMAVGLLISGNSWAAGDKNGATQDAVCKIGDQYYSTFAKAIADVPTTGVETVVELLKDCEAGGIGKEVSIKTGMNVTLNCNLFTIRNARTDSNGSSGANTTPVLKVYGTLTLNGTANADSSIVGGIDGLNFCVMTVESADAKITINSGRYQSHDKMAIIEINQSAELVINGGDFKGGNNGRYGMVVYNSSNDPKITINGGRFDASIEKCSNSQGSALIATRGNNPKVEINDGLFTIQYSGTKCYNVNACVDVRSKNAELTINGGTFINQTEASKIYSKQDVVALLVYEAVKKADITNGYFCSPNGMGGQIFSSQGSVNTINIEDVTFIGGYCGLMITNYVENNHITLNGGYYKSTGTMGIYVGAKSNVDFMWGKVENTGEGYGIYQADATSTLNITGGTITVASTKNAIRHNDGNLMIGGTVKLEGCLLIDGGNTTISGGSIIADKQGAVWVTGGNVTISNAPIITSTHSDGYAFYNAGGSANIDGGRFKSVHSVYGSAGTTTLSDGIYSVTPILNKYCDVKPDYEVIANLDPSTKDVYPYAIGKKHFEEQTVSEKDDRTIDWKNVDTWSGDHIIPDKGDDVTIADSKNVEVGESGHTDAYAHKITVDNGSDLIIDGGSKLTVGNGGIVLGSTGDGGEVIIKANAEDGTGVLLFSPVADEAVTTVEATIELHTTAHKDNEGNYFWNYIGIPLKTDNFMPTNWEKVPVVAGQETGSYLQTWDFTEGWVNNGLEAFKPFQGVAITNDSKDGVIYRFKGTMVGNADKNMQFKPRGYNFFANSYTAPIDIETLLNELKDNGVVDAAVYMFDTENNRFQSVALSAFAGFIPPYFRVIPSMNGFFILNQQTQAAQQLMDYGDAVYNCALGNRPLYAPQHEAMDFSRVHISVESNGSKDGLYLIENDEFTSEFENGYDVMKYMTDGEHNIYAQTAQGAQSELFNSNIEGTMIGFEASADQMEYTLTFDEIQGETFVLTDLETGATVEMSEGNTYTFFAQAGQNNENRFMVTRANKAPTAIDNVKGNVKAQGIYSVMGHYFGNVTEWKNMPSGVYVVNGVKVVK